VADSITLAMDGQDGETARAERWHATRVVGPHNPGSCGPRVRPIDPASADEIALVARRMRCTLIEVLGQERGGSMYDHAWLERRVRAHLTPAEIVGEVFLSEDAAGVVTGHCIVRVEQDDELGAVGLFSTVYVVPAHRRAGVATELVACGERWMRARKLALAVTYTDEDNTGLQTLFRARGYALTPMPRAFVRLARSLGG
jgi:GNAT superfamily N-acetyltransferase